MSRDSHSDGKFEFSEAMKNTSQKILPNEQERFIKNRGALEFKLSYQELWKFVPAMSHIWSIWRISRYS